VQASFFDTLYAQSFQRRIIVLQKDASKDKKKDSTEKLTYSSPKLIFHGRVSELTQGGSGTDFEAGGTCGGQSNGNNRKSCI
jgi:hypothetical protein